MPMRFKDKIEGTITNADYASSAGSVAWSNVSGKPSTFAPSTHTHNYAGSGSAGGSANSAVKLDTATAGSTTQPVYFSGGKPVAIGYTIQSSVPANAKFTDTNTTYDVFKAATASAAGGTGLVPAPAAGQQNYFLRGDKTWQALSKSSVGLGNVDNTADSAKSVKYATSAGSANSVAWSNISGKPTTFAPASHTHKYASGFSVSGTTVTVSYGDGTSSTFTTQDTNTTYNVFKAATASAAGGTGLVPAPAAGAQGYYLAGDSTWKAFSKSTVGLGNVDNTADSAKSVKYATSAGSANAVAWANVSGKPSTFAPSSHTHNYAGSASAGGAANSANFLNKNTTFKSSGEAGIQYYDAEITGATDVKHDGWGSPTEAWYQILHMPLSISGYYNDIAIPVNDVSGIAYRQRRSDSYYGWYRLLDSNNWSSYVTKSAIGLGSVDNTADSAKSVKYATSAGSANAVAWGNISGKPTTFAPASHTHNYAGSASAGGSANSAVKLDTATAGSATNPVYFSNGVPVATTYTLGKSVPSNAVFTDTNTWRGIQDNLTSTATDQSLSANQGKVLKGLVDGKAPASHTHKYASGFSVSGTTVTVSYGDGTSSTFKTQDTNTTYSDMKGATSSAAGTHGLVPAPVAGAQTKYLRGDGTWQTPPDTNTTYSVFKGATSSAAGGNGLVPAPASGVTSQYLKSTGTWGQVAWSEISGKPSTFTPASHTHTKSQITDFPTSLPASDVYAWAKASAKPSYSWNEISSKPSTFAPSAHTHDYLPLSGGITTGRITAPEVAATSYFVTPTMVGEGDTSTYYHRVDWGMAGNDKVDFYEYGGIWNFYKNTAAGKDSAVLVASIQADGVHATLKGTADTAVKLSTSTAGSATQPVYFSNGKPTACTYTLGKSVPSNAVFTDTHTLTLADRVSGKVVTCDAIPTT